MQKIIIFLLLALNCSAQNNKMVSSEKSYPIDNRLAKSEFYAGHLAATDTSTIKQFLLNHYPYLTQPGISLQLLNQKESPTGFHFLFGEFYRAIPVFRGSIKINLDKNGNITSLFDNGFALPSNLPNDFPTNAVCENVIKSLEPVQSIIVKTEISNQWFYDGLSFIPAARIFIADKNNRNFELIINKESKTIYEHDLNEYYSPPSIFNFQFSIFNSTDTPAVAMVFNPDPLTTAGVLYGTPYVNAHDSDVAVLNAQRQYEVIETTLNNDTFWLSSPFCEVKELSTPANAPAFSTTPYFNFTRSHREFNEVNAFYHINYFQQYLQHLGFLNLVNFPIQIDANNPNLGDNSFFNSNSSPISINYGTGGVPDAQDADVVTHEYGHAVSFSASNSNFGTERAALDEGIGDYIASSYSRYLNTFYWWYVFSWDGHNEFWPGRVSITSKHYPEDKTGEPHSDGEMWSSTIMQIWGDIGREAADKILFNSMYSYTTNISMKDAANLYIQSDHTLNNGINFTDICNRMCQRGFLPCACVIGIEEEKKDSYIKLVNTAVFATGGNAIIEMSAPKDFSLRLADVNGRLLFQHNIHKRASYDISGADLAPGIYFLSVIISEKEIKNFKLAKF